MSAPKKKLADQSLDQYRELFEEMDDIIMIISPSGKIEYVNRALRKHLGFKKKRFTGKNICNTPLYDQSIPKKHFVSKIYRKRSFVTQNELSNGDVRHLVWKTKAFKVKGKKHALAIIRDSSPQIQSQQKTEEYNQYLQETILKRNQLLEKEKQKAVELHHAKAIFLSKMSHEMRTPLTAVCGYTELLQDSEVDAKQRKKYLKIINKNAHGLLEMINETLSMIKLEQDKYQILEKSFQLPSLITDLVDTYKVLAEEKNLSLECKLPDDLPGMIHSDANAIKQILTNLIGNAIKFTHEGKVVLSVKLRSFPHKASKKIYFYVEDTGVGIPPEHHRRIFRSFEQYLENQAVYGRGTGLGLSISKQLAKLLGGNLKLLSSHPHEGSTFVFSLPLRTLV